MNFDEKTRNFWNFEIFENSTNKKIWFYESKSTKNEWISWNWTTKLKEFWPRYQVLNSFLWNSEICDYHCCDKILPKPYFFVFEGIMTKKEQIASFSLHLFIGGFQRMNTEYDNIFVAESTNNWNTVDKTNSCKLSSFWKSLKFVGMCKFTFHFIRGYETAYMFDGGFQFKIWKIVNFSKDRQSSLYPS